jgi:hypothetical protein
MPVTGPRAPLILSLALVIIFPPITVFGPREPATPKIDVVPAANALPPMKLTTQVIRKNSKENAKDLRNPTLGLMLMALLKR